MLSTEISVLISGAGPTGLTLACDLARRGVDFRIIDKAPEYFRGSKAKGLQPRSLEVMHFLGIADRIVAHGRFHMPMRNYENGAITMDCDMYETFYPTPDIPYASPLMIAQWRVEEALRGLLGDRVELGTELIGIEQGIEQNKDGVLATIRKGDATEQIRCQYLVGSDGGHSFVRKSQGIGFEGETWPNARMYVGDVTTGDLDCDHWHCWPNDTAGWVGMCPLATTGAFQFQAAIADENPPEPSLELFQRILDERTGAAIRLSSAPWLSLYRVNIRMVDRYRAGRVFLAGDAAHVHSPAGGQGMNTGIQDAWNLGWKLAMVLNGASPALLDTYEEERLPIAAGVLGISTRLAKQFVATGNRFSRSAETLQLGIHYRGSSLSQPANSTSEGLAPGDRAPDAQLPGGRLFDQLGNGRFLLLSGESGFTLIRPDGYIAWMGSDRAEAEAYLANLGVKEKAAP